MLAMKNADPAASAAVLSGRSTSTSNVPSKKRAVKFAVRSQPSARAGPAAAVSARTSAIRSARTIPPPQLGTARSFARRAGRANRKGGDPRARKGTGPPRKGGPAVYEPGTGLAALARSPGGDAEQPGHARDQLRGPAGLRHVQLPQFRRVRDHRPDDGARHAARYPRYV